MSEKALWVKLDIGSSEATPTNIPLRQMPVEANRLWIFIRNRASTPESLAPRVWL